jgi:hypothetical protein
MEKTLRSLSAHSPCTPKDFLKMLISRLKIIQNEKVYILSNYTKWVGLSQKTIERYCPFKDCGLCSPQKHIFYLSLSLSFLSQTSQEELDSNKTTTKKVWASANIFSVQPSFVTIFCNRIKVFDYKTAYN